ncbi:MAG: hypothetical protein AVDCRST_MAG53-2963 [uncultured Solirubrobacteraceae bacterium]|uniref:Uncharacterized protein n=1 Tax=uncultured Solirubrobacteraceae bacterium TaxID=1162706 RepID=A0A6J4T544_9ACTN|nr:MAG: hypothetical protein AVDCRST_MAG53-2963 [uncultured Solirubrobacteraceae bacterium]
MNPRSSWSLSERSPGNAGMPAPSGKDATDPAERLEKDH